MNLLFELKYVLRLLRRSPAYSATCVLVTSVGITVSLVAFTIIYTLSYKPLEYVVAENWYSMMFAMEGGLVRNTDDYFFQRLEEEDFQTFQVLGRQYGDSSVVDDGEASRRVPTGYASPALFTAARVKPLLGRFFREADGEAGSPATVLLSYEAWQVYYQGNPDIVGRASMINGSSHHIVGVLPQGFNMGVAQDIWLPDRMDAVAEPSLYGRGSPIIALNDNVEVEAANTELDHFFRQLKSEFPEIYANDRGVALSGANTLGAGAEAIYGMMALVAGIFVLFSCLNTGSLLFTNALRRQQEFAVRNAMGSTTWQLLKQSLLESFCMCFLAATIGALLSHGVLIAISQQTSSLFSGGGVNGSHHYLMELNLPSLVFLGTVVLLMWLLSGVIPVYRAISLMPKAGLANDAKGTAATGKSRATSFLAGFQIVFATFLLIVSGVLVSAMNFASQRDLGIDTKQVMTAHIPLSERFQTPEEKLGYLRTLEAEALAAKAISSVSFVSSLPSMEMVHTGYQLEDRESAKPGEGPADPLALVSDQYFGTVGVDILAGRPFDESDNARSVAVAIVDERLAQRYWPGESAIGKRIQLEPESNGNWLTVVGVASHVLGNNRFEADKDYLIYRPIYQSMPKDLRLVASYEGDFSDASSQIQQAARRANRDLPLSRVERLDDYYLNVNAMSFIAMMSRLFMYIAVITGLLAVIGIFAVFTRNIIRRTRETGIRRSLGATSETIIWLHLKKGLLFSVAGCGMGLLLALLIMGAMFSSGGIIAGEAIPLPFILVGVPGLLALSILLASWLPARQSVLGEPGDALRYE